MRNHIGVLAPFLSGLAILGLVRCTTFTLGPAPIPTITSLSPSSVTAGSPAFDLTINGSGFVNRFSSVRFGSVVYGPNDLVSVTGNAIVIRIGASSVATPRPLQVTVQNPTTFGGGGTATADFDVNHAVPNVTGVSTSLPPPNDQNAAPAGGPPFRMLVTGSGFAPGSLVRWDGIARITNFLSPTQITTDVAASDIVASRTVQVSVTNPAPGPSQSPTSVPFTIYAVPTVTSIVGIVPWFQTRVTFDDPPPPTTLAPLDGFYPRPPSSLPPRLNFPNGQWQWQEERVNNVMVRDAFFSNNPALPANSRTFSFANGPRILATLDVITKTAGTITLRDDTGRTTTAQITVGPVQTVATGWFAQPSAAITVEFTAGWELGITAISYLGLP
jgi:hypothetical protein